MKKERIYILPTRMGGYLNGLIFLMFLLSVGYSNNLLLIFTLFLFGLNLIWVIQTHFHLHGLKFGNIQVSDNFAQDITPVNIHWKKAPEGPLTWNLSLDKTPVTAYRNTKEGSQAHMVFPKRGVYHFKQFRVSTEMPFGLYRAWITFNVDVTAYAYPVKAKDLSVLPATPAQTEGENSTLTKGPHDVWNLGPYQGEESRKISWKHYARSGELVVKEGEELQEAEVKFELHGPDERQLSLLAAQLVYCSDKSIPFSLKTSSGKTEYQLRECLKELAKC